MLLSVHMSLYLSVPHLTTALSTDPVFPLTALAYVAAQKPRQTLSRTAAVNLWVVTPTGVA